MLDRRTKFYYGSLAALPLAASMLLWSCGHFTVGAPAIAPTFAQSLPREVVGPGTIVPDTWSGFHANQHFDGGISATQATADAARYDLIWGSTEPSAWRAGNPRIVTTWYAPFDLDFKTTNNLSWWRAHHPDWVLYQCDRKTPAWGDGLKNVPLDISNPAVVRWQMRTYAPPVESAGYTGFGLDLVGLNNANGGCGVFINKKWKPRFTGQRIDDTWSQAVLSWFAYAYPYVHAFPRPLALGINTVAVARPFGDPEEEFLLGHVDFVNDEFAFTNYGNGYAPASTVQSTIKWMKYIQGLGKTYIVDDKWNTTLLTHQQLGWALATYLLAKYHSATVFIDHLPGYGYEYWHPQYAASIGSPCGDWYPEQKFAGIYYRKYTGAFVAVNASSTNSHFVALPHPTYVSIWGNAVASPLLLAADDGEVLLTAKGCN